MKTNPKVIIYTRVSTDRQSAASQLSELQSYAKRRGWKNLEVIKDQISGAKFSRVGLDALMDGVRRGKIDIVLAFKLDRIGRSLPHLVQIIDELMRHKVALVVPSQGIDTSNDNPASKLQLSILGAVAEFEREVIRERVNAGLGAARARGVKLGRPATLHTKEAKVRGLLEKGLSGRRIAEETGIPAGSVFAIMKTIKAAA